MEWSQQEQAYDTKHAAKKFRILLIFAIFLGVLELGFWSYKHTQKQNTSYVKQESAQEKTRNIVATISQDEKSIWDYMAYHPLQDLG